MAQYELAWGTTWQITITVTRGGAPLTLTGYHLLCTVKKVLSDGSTDTAAVWQGDSNGTGIAILNQTTYPGQATITMPASATYALPNPTVPSGTPLYYDVVYNDGAGDIGETENGTIDLLPRTTGTQP